MSGNSKIVKVKTKVMVLDDHPMMRYGMGQMVDKEPDLMVCGDADSGPDIPQGLTQTQHYDGPCR